MTGLPALPPVGTWPPSVWAALTVAAVTLLAAAVWWLRTRLPWRRARHVAWQVACGALGIRPEKVSGPDPGHRRKVQREVDRLHRTQTVARLRLDGNRRTAAATIALPPSVDTSTDGNLRARFEALWAERHPWAAWRFDWRPDRVACTARPPLPDRADRPPSPAPHLLPVGQGHDGPVWWDTETTPMALVSGLTGSGKSVVVRGMLTAALDNGWQVVGLDPKRVELGWVADRGGTVATPDATGVAPMVDALRGTVTEMQRRYTVMAQAGDNLWDTGLGPPVLVVVDEAFDLLADRDLGDEALTLLTRLASQGRAARVHCLVATQQPYARVVDGALRENLGLRLLLGWATHSQSKMTLGTDHGSRTPPDAPPGRGWVRVGAEPEPVQCWWTPPVQRQPRRDVERGGGEDRSPPPPSDEPGDRSAQPTARGGAGLAGMG